ncbi:unnamed protein product [Prorocentrum cordatum]|uniref:Uncharacterized protein n=1 Tax=Prorocentrum cordatum TaxID=2364126 RepID=A0ABN9QL70_9DINO|nr:unnamed protein product [Polarella glacialis]
MVTFAMISRVLATPRHVIPVAKLQAGQPVTSGSMFNLALMGNLKRSMKMAWRPSISKTGNLVKRPAVELRRGSHMLKYALPHLLLILSLVLVCQLLLCAR